MKRPGKLLGWSLAGLFTLLLLALGYVWYHSPGQTAPLTDANGRPLPNSIAELTQLDLNGTQQWICVRGHDRRKPVLLFLHGGPGLPELPLLTGHPLEKYFVVVNWEQRGAGKSYDRRLFDRTFTVHTLVADAVQLSRYLAKRFNQPRIYLMAHSYGTFLGILVVQRHPELFRAFFSIGQIARQAEAEQISYDWTLQQAQQQGDSRTIERLKQHGRPEKLSGDGWLAYLTWQRELVADYHGGMYRGDFYPLFIRSILLCREYTLLDKINYAFGAQEAVRRLWPAAIAMDLNRTAPRLAVPYYLFQGVHDYQTPYRIARAYFDHVQAPQKRLFTFANSAHSPIFEEPERFMQLIRALVPQRTFSQQKLDDRSFALSLMDINIAAQIAQTHLLAKKRQTLVAMLGVTFGIAMFITMISFMQGVNQFLEDSALDASPHIRLYNEVNTQRPALIEQLRPAGFNVVYHQKPKNESAKLKNGLIMAERIEREPGVLGTSPQIATQVFYNNGPIQLSGTISGVDIDRENRLYKLTTRLKSGSLSTLKTNPDGLIMGTVLARKLNVRTGDKVTVTVPGGGTRVLRVVGTFGFGIGTVDNTKSYANLSTVQEILQRDPSYVTDIHVKMLDPLQAIPFGKKLRATYGYYTEDWATANTAILAGEKIRNMLTYVVSITLLVVAGFGIYNIMNMTVINKIKDIAILKATGFEGRDIVAIFLLQAAFIGFTGGLLGLGIGFGLSYLLSITPFDAGDFLSIKTFPVIFAPKYYALGLLFGVVTTVLAGYFPSRKAAQVDPVSILRG